MSKHTPTPRLPLKVFADRLGIGIRAGGMVIAQDIRTRADAELIVKAVNSHAALVKALKAAQDRICSDACGISRHAVECRAIDAALALAEKAEPSP